MKKILIYKDLGVSSLSAKRLLLALQEEGMDTKYELVFVDSHHLKKTQWFEQTSLLIFPGGRDQPYMEALSGIGNKNIHHFVHSGGKYLGICAGAYYGSGMIEFEKGNPLEIIDERELRFFPGLAKGPAYGLGSFSYENENGARIARLHLSSTKKSVAYYNGGCAFLNPENYPDVTRIASYDDLENQPAAIVSCLVGKGIAILSGVHPEYCVSHLEKMGHELSTKDFSEKKLFRDLLNHLNM